MTDELNDDGFFIEHDKTRDPNTPRVRVDMFGRRLDLPPVNTAVPGPSTENMQNFCPYIKIKQGVTLRNFVTSKYPGPYNRYYWWQDSDYVNYQDCQLQKQRELDYLKCANDFNNCPLYRNAAGLSLTDLQRHELKQITVKNEMPAQVKRKQ
ncbi:MAG: hypothetical protein WC346_09755 [Methanogenium sp.]|jgi:hypothetical protein